MIQELISATVGALTSNGDSFSFLHSEKDWQNIGSDEMPLPSGFLDMPVRFTPILTSSGYVENQFSCIILFLYKSELDNSPEQRYATVTKCMNACRDFLILLKNNEDDVKSITPEECYQVLNLFDSNLDGVALPFKIVLRNVDSVCVGSSPKLGSNYEIKDEDGNILYSGFLSVGSNLDQTIDNSVLSVKDSGGTILHEISLLAESIGEVTIDDSQLTNSDDSFSLSIKAESSEVLADVTHTDSDGSTVSFPAMKPFICSPASICEDAIINVNSVLFDTVVSGGTRNVKIVNDAMTEIGVINLGLDAVQIGNSEIQINNNVLTEIPAEVDHNISILDSEFNNPVGTIQSNNIVTIADSTAVLKDSAGGVISSTSILTEASQDITAPDGSVTAKNSENTSLGSVSVKSNGTADLIVADENITINSASFLTKPSKKDQNINLINIDGSPVVFTYSGANITVNGKWERPADWLDIDSYVNTGSDKFIGLKAIYNGKPNIQTIFSSQAFTVSIDGVATNYAAFTLVELDFVFSAISAATTTSEGFRQVRIEVYPQSGSWTGTFSIATARTVTKPTSFVSGFIDIRMHAPSLTGYTMLSTTGGRMSHLKKHNWIGTLPAISRSSFNGTSLRWLGDNISTNTSLASFLSQTPKINQFIDPGSIPNFTLNTTSINNLLSGSQAIYIGNFTANSATATSTSAFANMYRLIQFGNLSLALTTSCQSMFSNDILLETVGTINIPAATSIASLFTGDSKLRTHGSITSGNVLTTIANAWDGCKLLEGINVSDCTGVTTTTLALNECHSLMSLILTGLTRGITVPPNQMDDAAFAAFFTSLGTASGAQTIVITGNITLTAPTLAIATGKGFTVTP